MLCSYFRHDFYFGDLPSVVRSDFSQFEIFHFVGLPNKQNEIELRHAYVCKTKKKKVEKSSETRKTIRVKKQTYRNVLSEKRVFTAFGWSAAAAVLVLSLVLHGTEAAGTGLGGPSLIHGGRNVVL